ncbi:hypothetical protein OROMI_007786 [Orobanche minor]
MTTRYWAASLPVGQGSSASSLWSRLQESISKQAFDTALYRFNIPNLHVGTLDSLLALSDDLFESKNFIEGVSHKIRRQIEELERVSGVISSSLTVGGVPVDSYLTSLCGMNEAKYPTMSPLKEIVDGIHAQIVKIGDDLKLKYSKRFLHMIVDADVQKIFKTRARVIQYMRDFLNARGFIEVENHHLPETLVFGVETPVLCTTPSFGAAKSFVVLDGKNEKLYLRNAPECYLKQLVVEDMKHVYEIGKQFMNEDIDRTHHPEFTSCKFCMAYSDYEDLIAERITFDGKVVHGSTFFRYLGSIIQKDGELDGDVAHRIKAGWLKWKSAIGVLCDPDMPHRLKGKFYRTAIRPALLYGTECWAVKQCHFQKMNVAEMRMLRWMCGHTKKDRLRNEVIREKVRVASIEDKMMENRLRWFGHVRRRPVDAPVRRLESWGQVILSKVEADRRKLG